MNYLIVDGYNLIFTCGLGDRHGDAVTLEKARGRLLRELGTALDVKLRKQTTIVFDARHRPPGVTTNRYAVSGMTVIFADEYPDADALIVELIRKHPVPGSLTVVSSDHQLQRAAHARKATSEDSERWYESTIENRPARANPGPVNQESKNRESKDRPIMDDSETASMLKEIEADLAGELNGASRPQSSMDSSTPSDSTLTPNEKIVEEKSAADDGSDPFPPGWFDDLPSE